MCILKAQDNPTDFLLNDRTYRLVRFCNMRDVDICKSRRGLLPLFLVKQVTGSFRGSTSFLSAGDGGIQKKLTANRSFFLSVTDA